MPAAVENNVFIDLIGIDPDIRSAPGHDDFGYAFELILCGHTPGRVGREIEDDEFCPGCDQPLQLPGRKCEIPLFKVFMPETFWSLSAI